MDDALDTVRQLLHAYPEITLRPVATLADVPETRKPYDPSEPVEPIDFLAWVALWVPCFL